MNVFDRLNLHLSDLVTTHRSAIYGLLTVLVLCVVYKLATRALRAYLNKSAHKPENVQNFLFLWRYLWLGVGAVLALVSFSGSIAALGISAAFLGMVLGWSLQAPVTGIAAWLMILLKRPFKIGDRIIIAGIVGDVVDINLTHIIMNQVGGTIGGEEKSGRGVLIPNAILFQQVIYNYAFETEYLLDEVVVNITFESDLEGAKRICIEAAGQVTSEIVAKAARDPFVRCEIMDWGVRLRCRYLTLATDRQRISSDISEMLLREFARNDRVEFAYPHTEILHRPKVRGLHRPDGGPALT